MVSSFITVIASLLASFVASLVHTSYSAIADAHIAIYSCIALIAFAVRFQLISNTRKIIRVKLFSLDFICARIILGKFFCQENLLDENKAKYGS